MHKTVHLLLIRHAQTEENIRGAYLGCKTDVSISESGKEKSHNLSCKISGLLDNRFNLWSSPMRRCIETAGILFPNKSAVIIDEFMEMDFGEFEGLSYKELNGNPYYQRWIDSGGTIPFPNGEDRKGFVARTVIGLKKVLDMIECESEGTDDINGVIVAHGGTIMAIMSELTRKDYYDFHIGNLEGYQLKLELVDGEINNLSYNRI